MKHLCLYEAFPTVYNEPTYTSNLFRIRYRNNMDLSNKKMDDTKPKPINDVLDGFQQGDIVSGTGMEADQTYKGRVTRIEKDGEGENSRIFIEVDGKIVELKPSSVTMEEEIGNADRVITEPFDADKTEETPTGTTLESKNYSIKRFGEF